MKNLNAQNQTSRREEDALQYEIDLKKKQSLPEMIIEKFSPLKKKNKRVFEIDRPKME